MILWFIFASMTAAAIFAVVWPLGRVPRAAGGGSDLLVYKDQLQEIDRDRTAGLTLGSKVKTTPEHVLRAVVAQLPKGWHVTLLPSHVIMYKNNKRKFPSGRLIGKSPGTR
jgi:cytochrome c-type biogenesis protein CcmH